MKNINEAMKNLKDIRIIEDNEIIMEMANLTSRRTGLPAVTIWSDQSGINRNKPDNDARVKITGLDYEVSVSIEKKPRILARTKNIKQSEMNNIKAAMEYIGRNYDLFLKHYESSEDIYDDDDLKNDLRKRGDYK